MRDLHKYTYIETHPRFASDNYDWEPRLHPYQQIGANVLFFTFINPATMDVPVAFKKLGNLESGDNNTDAALTSILV